MNYQLRSSTTALVDIPSSSTLDDPHVRLTRRGTVHRTLGGIRVQYSDAPILGDTRIIWRIPLADATEYGRLYSASIGAYGDLLVFTSPVWGAMDVAFEPGENGFRPKKHVPESFGYEIEIVFVRLS